MPASSATSPVTPPSPVTPQRKRHAELDVLRGGLLVYMAINHVPSVTWRVTTQPLGFMTPAEGFVLLAGLLIGLLYTGKYLRDGPRATTPALLRRAGKIYVAHLACMAGVLVWMLLYQGITGSETPPVASPWAWVQRPFSALPAALLLIHQPGLLDVLPLYCGLVLLTPFVLGQLMRERAGLVLGVSGSVWAATNAFIPAHPFVHGVINTGAFNFGAWQFLYVLGVVAGHLGARDAVPAALRPGRLLTLLSASGLGLGLLCAHGQLTLGLSPEIWTAWTNKNNLAPLRMLNVACVFFLLWCWLGRARADGTPRLRCAPLARLGRHSLPVFSVHVVVALIILGLPWWFEWTRWGPWVGPAVLLAAMFATATRLERLATTRRPAPPSTT